jgi:hypothetical protein
MKRDRGEREMWRESGERVERERESGEEKERGWGGERESGEEKEREWRHVESGEWRESGESGDTLPNLR